jgi:hypothetical protein
MPGTAPASVPIATPRRRPLPLTVGLVRRHFVTSPAKRDRRRVSGIRSWSQAARL